MFYPLAADSDGELAEWSSVLTRAIGMETEEIDTGGERVGGLPGVEYRSSGLSLGGLDKAGFTV